ncbi:hypothetical protein BV20DRAFT_732679 [Pilatotrama ljubarskyi]|nr:hypothetical protein BV20DRAFT_732679 [Pilatotrama ljubarskyi]
MRHRFQDGRRHGDGQSRPPLRQTSHASSRTLHVLPCRPHTLRNGVKRQDGVLEKLTDEDFTRCIRAIPALANSCYAHMRRTLDWSAEELFKECTQPDECKQAAKQAAISKASLPREDSFRYLFVRADKKPPRSSRAWSRTTYPLDWACAPCLKFRLKRSTDICREAWRQLPTWLLGERPPGWT